MINLGIISLKRRNITKIQFTHFYDLNPEINTTF